MKLRARQNVNPHLPSPDPVNSSSLHPPRRPAHNPRLRTHKHTPRKQRRTLEHNLHPPNHQPYAQSTYLPTPQETVYRGANGVNPENYSHLYKDAAAAYQLALRWKITNETSYANAATNILSSWALTVTTISGNSDKYLASGLYGYQLANAAEVMRDYPGWDSGNKTATARMLTDVFAAMNNRFLEDHNDTDNYWHLY